MTNKTSRYLSIGIGALFLIYGLVRMGVPSLLILQSNGILADNELQGGLDDVIQFLAMVQDQALVPMSASVYLIYIWAMGVLLVVGGIGCIIKKSVLKPALYVFLFLYALLFINFQTINPKVFHMIACAGLLMFYNYLNRSSSLLTAN